VAYVTPTAVTAGDAVTAASYNVLVNNDIALRSGHLILTTTERNALSSPLTGTEIYNTTTGAFEMYNGTSWVINRPFAIANGSTYGGASATVVTFPANRFTVAPLVVLTNVDSTVTPILGAVTTSQFTYTNSVGSNNTMNYIATQMSATASIA